MSAEIEAFRPNRQRFDQGQNSQPRLTTLTSDVLERIYNDGADKFLDEVCCMFNEAAKNDKVSNREQFSSLIDQAFSLEGQQLFTLTYIEKLLSHQKDERWAISSTLARAVLSLNLLARYENDVITGQFKHARNKNMHVFMKGSILNAIMPSTKQLAITFLESVLEGYEGRDDVDSGVRNHINLLKLVLDSIKEVDKIVDAEPSQPVTAAKEALCVRRQYVSDNFDAVRLDNDKVTFPPVSFDILESLKKDTKEIIRQSIEDYLKSQSSEIVPSKRSSRTIDNELYEDQQSEKSILSEALVTIRENEVNLFLEMLSIEDGKEKILQMLTFKQSYREDYGSTDILDDLLTKLSQNTDLKDVITVADVDFFKSVEKHSIACFEEEFLIIHRLYNAKDFSGLLRYRNECKKAGKLENIRYIFNFFKGQGQFNDTGITCFLYPDMSYLFKTADIKNKNGDIARLAEQFYEDPVVFAQKDEFCFQRAGFLYFESLCGRVELLLSPPQLSKLGSYLSDRLVWDLKTKLVSLPPIKTNSMFLNKSTKTLLRSINQKLMSLAELNDRSQILTTLTDVFYSINTFEADRKGKSCPTELGDIKHLIARLVRELINLTPKQKCPDEYQLILSDLDHHNGVLFTHIKRLDGEINLDAYLHIGCLLRSSDRYKAICRNNKNGITQEIKPFTSFLSWLERDFIALEEISKDSSLSSQDKLDIYRPLLEKALLYQKSFKNILIAQIFSEFRQLENIEVAYKEYQQLLLQTATEACLTDPDLNIMKRDMRFYIHSLFSKSLQMGMMPGANINSFGLVNTFGVTNEWGLLSISVSSDSDSSVSIGESSSHLSKDVLNLAKKEMSDYLAFMILTGSQETLEDQADLYLKMFADVFNYLQPVLNNLDPDLINWVEDVLLDKLLGMLTQLDANVAQPKLEQLLLLAANRQCLETWNIAAVVAVNDYLQAVLSFDSSDELQRNVFDQKLKALLFGSNRVFWDMLKGQDSSISHEAIEFSFVDDLDNKLLNKMWHVLHEELLVYEKRRQANFTFMIRVIDNTLAMQGGNGCTKAEKDVLVLLKEQLSHGLEVQKKLDEALNSVHQMLEGFSSKDDESKKNALLLAYTQFLNALDRFILDIEWVSREVNRLNPFLEDHEKYSNSFKKCLFATPAETLFYEVDTNCRKSSFKALLAQETFQRQMRYPLLLSTVNLCFGKNFERLLSKFETMPRSREASVQSQVDKLDLKPKEEPIYATLNFSPNTPSSTSTTGSSATGAYPIYESDLIEDSIPYGQGSQSQLSALDIRNGYVESGAATATATAQNSGVGLIAEDEEGIYVDPDEIIPRDSSDDIVAEDERDLDSAVKFYQSELDVIKKLFKAGNNVTAREKIKAFQQYWFIAKNNSQRLLLANFTRQIILLCRQSGCVDMANNLKNYLRSEKNALRVKAKAYDALTVNGDRSRLTQFMNFEWILTERKYVFDALSAATALLSVRDSFSKRKDKLASKLCDSAGNVLIELASLQRQLVSDLEKLPMLDESNIGNQLTSVIGVVDQYLSECGFLVAQLIPLYNDLVMNASITKELNRSRYNIKGLRILDTVLKLCMQRVVRYKIKYEELCKYVDNKDIFSSFENRLISMLETLNKMPSSLGSVKRSQSFIGEAPSSKRDSRRKSA